MYYSEDLSSIVIDLGSTSLRVGYAGDDLPRFINPAFVGDTQSTMEEENAKRYYTGTSNLSYKRQNMDIRQVYSQGMVQDFDLYETLIRNTLVDDMLLQYEEYSVLLSEENALRRDQREKLAEIYFEHFNIKNLYFCKNAVLSCFATGRSTAVVVDSGAYSTSATTVHDGFALVKSARKANVGGENITQLVGEYLTKELGVDLSPFWRGRDSYVSYHRNSFLRDIKESLFKEEAPEATTVVEMELPDKQIIKIDKTRIPDIMFGGSASPLSQDETNTTFKGVQHLVTENIGQCDIDIKKQLYNNIIVTGGNSLLGGFSTKLQQKMTDLNPPVKLKTISLPFPVERRYSSWIGGSILGSLSSFQAFWVGKAEWSEYGVGIIDKKCA